MENTQDNETNQEMPIEQLLLDAKMEKYKLIAIATRWIEEISRKEEYKYLTFNQLLEVALRDILTDKVPIEYIKKLPPIDRKRMRSAAPGYTGGKRPVSAPAPVPVAEKETKKETKKEVKEDVPAKKSKKK